MALAMGAEMQTILNNPLATPFTLGARPRAFALRWRLCWGRYSSRIPAASVYPGQCHLSCAFIRVTPTVLPVDRRRRIP